MKGETKTKILLILCYYQLKKQKISINAISKELGLDWHTVDKYVQELSYKYQQEILLKSEKDL